MSIFGIKIECISGTSFIDLVHTGVADHEFLKKHQKISLSATWVEFLDFITKTRVKLKKNSKVFFDVLQNTMVCTHILILLKLSGTFHPSIFSPVINYPQVL